MLVAEKSLLLQILDHKWRDHLLSLDHLRQAVGLRAYAQKDPLREYQREAFNLFDRMLDAVRESVTQMLMHVEIRVDGADLLARRQQQLQAKMQESRSDPALASAPPVTQPQKQTQQIGDWDAGPVVRRTDPNKRKAGDPGTWGRVGRNEACPCGSGKKYKHCHGRLESDATVERAS
jgi:preprotein translocase subunit SecA